MALYTLGDTHLSLSVNKPMDVFGGVWQGYLDKLAEGFSILRPEDTLVIPGDISWGMSLEEAEADFAWLDAWPGTKILLKGNHDYWWNSMAKMTRFFEEKGFTSLKILHNTCYFYGNVALCGSRGWFFEEEGPDKAQNEKILNREVGRLEMSLKAAGDKEKLCFLHYPPIFKGYRCPPVLDLLTQYGVTTCYYGHLHGKSLRRAVQSTWNGVAYRLVSADYLNFQPEKILD